MARTTWLLAAAAVSLAAVTGWITLDNRDLRKQLAAAQAAAAEVRPSPQATGGDDGDGLGDRRRGERSGLAGLARALSSAPPVDKNPPPESDGAKESRMERRSRRSAEVAALLGRLDGESEADYRERVMPIITGVLERPRQRAQELRKEAEAKAGITPEQSAKVDEALAATYIELIDYTDAAISEGQVSPYQRNVSGWLGYAGGLGGILGGTEGKIGSILTPEQARTMYDSGFEWGEYLSVSAPWERLRAPPPPKPGQQQ